MPFPRGRKEFSPAQRGLFFAAAADPEVAKRRGISQSAARKLSEEVKRALRRKKRKRSA